MEYKPLVSVIMAVYNTDVKMLRDAVNSILNQTYQNFELILIDDNSTNQDTREYLRELCDEKNITVIRNSTNRGLAYSLNVGIRNCNGIYIARMDSDDISNKNRLANQVKYMESNLDITVLGTRSKIFGDSKGKRLVFPDSSEFIVTNFLFSVGITHPSVMIRKKFLEENKLEYNENFRKSQDYELWVRMSKKGAIFYELPEYLLLYRTSCNQASAPGKNKDQVKNANIIKSKLLSELGLISSKDNLLIHNYLSYANPHLSKVVSLENVFKWKEQILKANKEKEIYDDEILRQVIACKWLDCLFIYFINVEKFKSIKLTFKSIDKYLFNAFILRIKKCIEKRDKNDKKYI